MTLQERIETKLRQTLSPEHLEVENESSRHNVPAGSETHFKVIVVSKRFEGRTLVARHREVYGLLGEELKDGVHALSIQAHTPAEWEKAGPRRSPPCAS